MRTEKAHLRTRVPEHGMNYKGFNVAMHELGHNVEQVFSLYRLDHTLLQGVPNTAFTEGFAFVFQARDLEVLGLSKPDTKADALKTLDAFWATREIAGVGLVDMRVWRWMYAHPDATPEQLRKQVTAIAKEVWNSYYAPVIGVKDSPILAVYSHMINNGLYLPDYPIGHLIAFQIEDYFKSHPLAKEMERMCSQGRLAPNLWMKQAIGTPISSKPLLEATEKALRLIKQ
jgi:oligoendopeptidase F